MFSKLTFKLAYRNLIQNKLFYLPFLLISSLLYVSFYLFLTLVTNKDITSLRGGETIATTLSLGIIVVGIISLIILLYGDSIIMKNRQKEIGLYRVLGLENHHLLLMTFNELTMVYITIAILSTGIGALLQQLFYSSLLAIVGLQPQLSSHFSFLPVIITAVIFLGFFFVLWLFNLVSLAKTKPLTLLNESQAGEKRPKFSWIILAIGLISISIGYYIAVTIKEPITAVMTFFIAVLLVILATYCLFTSGTIAFLTSAKRHKNFYYRPQSMIAISNLLFRMKKNAAGLASICILSTMTIITMSMVISLYFGTGSYMEKLYPTDFLIQPSTLASTDENGEIVTAIAPPDGSRAFQEKLLSTYDFEPTDKIEAHYNTVMTEESNKPSNALTQLSFYSAEDDLQEIYRKPFSVTYVLDQETYNNLYHQSIQLNDDQIGYWVNGQDQAENVGNLTIDDQSFTTTAVSKDPMTLIPDETASIIQYSVAIVVNNTDAFFKKLPNRMVDNQFYTGFNSNLPEDKQIELYEKATKIHGDDVVISSKYDSSRQYLSFNGGIFFIGILLSIIFTSCLILVIYYKQISEGYEDRANFSIVQKVGISDKDIKTSVRLQVLLMFFLPVVTAMIHTAFAYPMLHKISQLLLVTDVTILQLSIMGTIGTFFLIYMVVYWLTSHQYTKLVTRATN